MNYMICNHISASINDNGKTDKSAFCPIICPDLIGGNRDAPAGNAAAAGDDACTRSGDMGSTKDDRRTRSWDAAGIWTGMFTGIFVMSTINLTLVGPKKYREAQKSS